MKLILILLTLAAFTGAAQRKDDGTVTAPRGYHWGLEKNHGNQEFAISRNNKLYVCLTPVYTALDTPLNFTVAPFTTGFPEPGDACTEVTPPMIAKLNQQIREIRKRLGK